MYNEELENLIDAALTDGVLTDKEKQILFKKAQAMGVDLDEFEVIVETKLEKLKRLEQVKSEISILSKELERVHGKDKIKKLVLCAVLLVILFVSWYVMEEYLCFYTFWVYFDLFIILSYGSLIISEFPRDSDAIKSKIDKLKDELKKAERGTIKKKKKEK